MTTLPRLVFFGTEQFSVPSLSALVQAGFLVVAVVTKPDAVKGRGKKAFIHPVKEFAETHGIAVLQPDKLDEIEHTLRALRPTAAVLVSYGKIISKRILDVFEPVGVVNLHPSLLPRFRGPSPITAAIIAGDNETGVTIMKLDEGMDTGPIYTQQTYHLTGTETRTELETTLAQRGAQLLVQQLPSIVSGKNQPKPQSKNGVVVTTLLKKADGRLDPLTDTATILERKIRAYQGFPKPRLTLNGIDVIITSSSVVSSPDSSALTISCANNSWLTINTLLAPSGREMSAAAYLNGLQNVDRKNARLQDR